VIHWPTVAVCLYLSTAISLLIKHVDDMGWEDFFMYLLWPFLIAYGVLLLPLAIIGNEIYQWDMSRQIKKNLNNPPAREEGE
jgi:hypothetical protein